jgi:pimeloyl-ACP methyl ester carboxylesterase
MIKEIIIDGTQIASWVNDGGFVEERKYLVFIHGSGGEHTLWENQYRVLQSDFNIAAVNLPGHGLSGGKGERDVMVYVEWVKKMITGLGIKRPPVLIGHSLGAAISLTFAI